MVLKEIADPYSELSAAMFDRACRSVMRQRGLSSADELASLFREELGRPRGRDGFPSRATLDLWRSGGTAVPTFAVLCACKLCGIWLTQLLAQVIVARPELAIALPRTVSIQDVQAAMRAVHAFLTPDELAQEV